MPTRDTVQAGSDPLQSALADEINRTSTKTQSALLEVMEEGRVTVDGVTRQLPNPLLLATQNPVGSLKFAQMLPESQLDRFMIGFPWDIQRWKGDTSDQGRQEVNPIDHIREIITKQELLEMQEQVRSVFVDDRY